jgi:hypothetical protein
MELIQAGGKTYSEIHKRIMFVIRKNVHSSRRTLLYLFIRKDNKTNCSNYWGILLLTIYTSYQTFFCHGYSQGLKNFMLVHQSGKYVTRQLKIVLLAFLLSLPKLSRLTAKYEFYSLLSILRYCWFMKCNIISDINEIQVFIYTKNNSVTY